MIDEDVANHSGSHGKEVRTVLPPRVSAIDQAEIRLVDECGGVERMVRSFTAESPTGDASKLLVHECDEFVEGLVVSLGGLLQ